MIMGSYIKFIGKYTDLKLQGFVFQKLYADNYMQWERDGVRVWKYGAEVTIDDVKGYEGDFLKLALGIRDKTITPVRTDGCLVVVRHTEKHKLEGSKESLDKHLADENLSWKWWLEREEPTVPDYEEPVVNTSKGWVDFKLVDNILGMYDNKQLEIVTYDDD